MKNETDIRDEIEGLRNLTTAQLKEKYREVFGEQSRSNHKQFLFRRIAWRIQANPWGGLSERARRRHMKWIDEVSAGMERDRGMIPAKSSAGGTKVDPTERVKKQSPGALSAWSALVSSISRDVNEFNKHKKRAGQTAVCMSQGSFQCQVYLPGMPGKRLVLTLANNSLKVSVHPEFPKQQSTITIELDKEGQYGSWVLGKRTKENAQLSVQELSEYLLKPIVASADINRDV